MAKRIIEKPNWLKANGIADIYSISDCLSKPFADYIDFWKHNGFWLFNSPEIIKAVSEENAISLEGTKLFYYEVYEFEYHEDEPNWRSFEPEQSFDTVVLIPNKKVLEGVDVATFSVGTSPECSPLSCNSLAGEIKTNSHCLIGTLEEAKQSLVNGKFKNAEPGPYRIFTVYTTDWP